MSNKYIPCIHCTAQECDSCDYHLHKEAVNRIGEYKENLESLRKHFESYTDDDVFAEDYETMWEILRALEMVK